MQRAPVCRHCNRPLPQGGHINRSAYHEVQTVVHVIGKYGVFTVGITEVELCGVVSRRSLLRTGERQFYLFHFLPQQTDVQKDFPASVYEVVLSGRLNSRGLKPFYTAADKQQAYEKMEILGIRDLAKQCFRDLSGGQRQRVLLARALCATKTLLLLDEPVTGLDPIVTAEFYQLISRINRDSGIAVVMVSHDIESAVEYASHILHLQEKVLFFGTAEDYRRSRVGRTFLGGDRND